MVSAVCRSINKNSHIPAKMIQQEDKGAGTVSKLCALSVHFQKLTKRIGATIIKTMTMTMTVTLFMTMTEMT